MSREFSSDEKNEKDILDEVFNNTSRYPKPLNNYLEFLSYMDESIKNKTSNEYFQIAEIIEKEIIKGKYEINKDKKIIYKNEENLEVELHMASSTVKTILGLIFYLKHIAQKGDYLIIDEPELNLHPDNQRRIVRVLCMIANSGINIVASTHSDYIVKEINNMLLLSNDFPEKNYIMEKYGCNDLAILNKSKISAYVYQNSQVSEMEITEDKGIIMGTFDNVINELNSLNNELYYLIQEFRSGDLDE